METPLLSTKLFVPGPRPALVSRPRLMDRIQATLTAPLTLVSAPAGFGKTTILSQWIARSGVPAVWYQIESSDNNTVRFWDYFIAAVKTKMPAFGDAPLAMLHSSEQYPIETVLTVVINNLVTVSRDFIIVLDDYQFIKSPPIHSSVAFLVEHLPSKIHLVLMTRSDPPLPLGRYRGSDIMLEVRADDLRMDDEEASALLKEEANLTLSQEDISSLNKHAEGWAVGLKMAAITMRRHRDVKRFIAEFTGSNRYIMDYLVEEVLDQQTDDAYDFLLKTSILDRLSVPLCDHVTGGGSRRMLTLLDQENLFLVPLDESRSWYRYHHLFAELLRHRLDAEFGPDRVRAFHRLASQWFDAQGLSDEAIQHSLAAQDWIRSMDLIYDPDEKRIKRGENATLLRWLETIPDAVLKTRPQLYRQYVHVIVHSGDPTEAENVLNRLDQSAAGDADLQGEIIVHRASLARNRNEYGHSIDLFKKALPMLNPENHKARSIATFILGLYLWEQGDFDQAERLLAEGHQAASKFGYNDTAAGCLNFRATIVSYRGRLRESAYLLRRAIELTDPSPASVRPRLSLSQLLYEWNELDSAAFQQQRVIEFSQAEGSLAGMAQGHFFLAHTRLAQGDLAAARASMAKADELVSRPGTALFTLSRHAAFRALFAVRENDAEAIQHWGERVVQYADAMPPFAWHVPGRVLVALGETAAARERLEAAFARCCQNDLRRLMLKIRVCQALASENETDSLELLGDALRLGEPEHHLRTFVDEGGFLAPMLRKAVSRNVAAGYAAQILRMIQVEERRQELTSGSANDRAPVGVLSDREMEVLPLLDAGLSNREIAERLVITLATAKTHVHSISRKLEARSRTQILTRARELKLI